MAELKTILNQAPKSSDCDGLIYSFVLAQNTVLGKISSTVIPAYPIQEASGVYGQALHSPMATSVFFQSTSGPPNVSSSRRAHLFQVGLINVPRYGGAVAPYNFWTMNDLIVTRAAGLY